MKKKILLIPLALLLALSLVATGCPAPERALSIATGGVGGTYYPLGGGVAEIITKHVPGLTATAESTGASVANVRMIHAGEVQMAMTQTDVAREAYEGVGRFEGEKLDSLRGLFSMYPEYAHFVTLKKSPIYTIADIVGKRLSTGAPGSGTEVICRYIITALGYTLDDFEISRLSFAENVAALKDGTIDVGFWIVGYPTSSIIDLSTTHEIRIIPVSAEDVERVNALYPYYFAGVIPAGTYRGVDVDAPSLYVGSIMLTHKDMQDEDAYEIVKAVFENVDYLRIIHVAANHTTLESGPKVAIPLHPGAEKYYREMGVLK